ncbi:hypothetical protein VNO78_27073 [Psophocarpus tetragonolobus]|uniref:ZF-HD dimerization-type domain-containing protein n=1 Tax=Psophocarpus tetragonolobus TaxID=3891 RepID=A0AAN9S061_PSOTE
MEYEEHEEAEFAASYDDQARVKMITSQHQEEEEEAAPVTAVTAVSPAPTVGSRNKGKYKECLKNHAVGLGGHALDGCGEFMPAGPDGTLESFKCAACNCHRNFHRKECPDGVGAPSFPPPRRHQFSPAYYRAPTGYLTQRGGALALPSTSGGTHSPRDQEDVSDHPCGGGGSHHKKRFRTKFSQEQKDKMLAFAEKLGWRIQKHDENVVQEFCSQTGVQRHVLKVWMHNNKHTLGKKP